VRPALVPIAAGAGAAGLTAGSGRRRLLLVALACACLALSLVALQQAFDAGDRRRALAALAATPAAGAAGPALAELLRQRNGGGPASCAAQVLSATRGITRVTCAVAGDPVPYRFLWDDLRRDRLRPEDDPTRARLER